MGIADKHNFLITQIPKGLFGLLSEYDKKQEPYLECTVGSTIRILRNK